MTDNYYEILGYGILYKALKMDNNSDRIRLSYGCADETSRMYYNNVIDDYIILITKRKHLNNVHIKHNK